MNALALPISWSILFFNPKSFTTSGNHSQYKMQGLINFVPSIHLELLKEILKFSWIWIKYAKNLVCSVSYLSLLSWKTKFIALLIRRNLLHKKSLHK